MADKCFLLSVFCSVVSLAVSEYLCVCNHHTQRGIFGSPSLNSPPLGFLYKDECKALVSQPNLDKKWTALQFFHTIGYIQTDSEVDIILCQGSIPDEDKASTIFPPTTIKPGQGSSFITIPVSSSSPTGPFSSGTSNPALSSSTSSPFTKPTTPTPIHTTITLSSTASTTVQVTQIPVSQTHAPMKPTTAPALKGYTQLCPANVQRGAQISGFLLAQFSRSCFEICNEQVSWYHADAMCKGRGGHLASLSNLQENNYLQTFISQHYHDKSFWIGLNDLNHEEHFHWSSGERVHFTNWNSHRKNANLHSVEDCVVMLKDGKWDDKQCGGHLTFTEYLQTRFPYVCEYGIAVGTSLIG